MASYLVKGLLAAAVLVPVSTLGLALFKLESLERSVQLGNRVAELKRERQELLAQNAAARSEFAALRQEVQWARQEQARSQCKAQVARIEAQAVVAQTQCLKDHAEHTECLARNEAGTAKSGLFGCMLGLGAAVISGGAAAPLTLAGCGGGVVMGATSETDCPRAPACTLAIPVIEAAVLAEQGLTQKPDCEMGLEAPAH
jgi:hypothetical protein